MGHSDGSRLIVPSSKIDPPRADRREHARAAIRRRRTVAIAHR